MLKIIEQYISFFLQFSFLPTTFLFTLYVFHSSFQTSQILNLYRIFGIFFQTDILFCLLTLSLLITWQNFFKFYLLKTIIDCLVFSFVNSFTTIISLLFFVLVKFHYISILEYFDGYYNLIKKYMIRKIDGPFLHLI